MASGDFHPSMIAWHGAPAPWVGFPPQPVQARLSDDDVERIARRVVELLREA